jgi:hypothetical protein
MLRGLILLLLALVVGFLALPFVMTSRALDEHGITLPGTVYHKSETVKVGYSEWELAREITVQYTIPESSSVGFFTVHPNTKQYDSLHTRQTVDVRYLRRKDVPELPGSKILWEIHALPTARLTNFRNVSRLDAVLTPRAILGCEILAGILALLILWRVTRSSTFAWMAAIGVLPLVALILLSGFPRPTSAPSGELRRATGRVASVGRIDKLFSGSRSRGVPADQPVAVVGVEFVPDGMSEPVVAVDLIDSGSIPGLKEKSTVTVQYEAASPRTAYIEGATRRFPERNFSGAVVTALLYLAAVIAMLGVAWLLGRGYNRLLGRSATSRGRNSPGPSA